MEKVGYIKLSEEEYAQIKFYLSSVEQKLSKLIKEYKADKDNALVCTLYDMGNDISILEGVFTDYGRI